MSNQDTNFKHVKLRLTDEPKQYEINGDTICIFYHVVKVEVERAFVFSGNEEKTIILNEWCAQGIEVQDRSLIELLRDAPFDENTARKLAEYKVKGYSTSNIVRNVSIHGINTWFDNSLRASLKTRFDAEVALGYETTTLWCNGTAIELPLLGENGAIDMLNKIEVYAGQCYNATQKHIATLSDLHTYNEISEYSYKAGYPEQLVL